MVFQARGDFAEAVGKAGEACAKGRKVVVGHGLESFTSPKERQRSSPTGLSDNPRDTRMTRASTLPVLTLKMAGSLSTLSGLSTAR